MVLIEISSINTIYYTTFFIFKYNFVLSSYSFKNNLTTKEF